MQLIDQGYLKLEMEKAIDYKITDVVIEKAKVMTMQ